jgi:NADPH2:quinone reductase
MRAIVFTGAGGAEVMRLEERPDPVPGKGEVLVEQRFAGINPADLMQRAGNYPAPPGSPPDIPGLEVSGRIAAVGDGVIDLAAGDRVFGIVGGGGIADRVVVPTRHLARVPDALSDEKAAAVPETYITAHDAVITQCRLRMGETLLVNGANGGVGTAAVQLGLATSARVLATVRHEAARERLREWGAQPVELADVRDAADVVIELVGAPNMAANLDAAARLGRIVVVGTGAGADFDMSLRKLLGKRLQMMGTHLRWRPFEEKAAAVQAFAHEVVPLLAAGTLDPPIDRVFPVEEAAEAFAYMAEPGKFGKVLLQFS